MNQKHHSELIKSITNLTRQEIEQKNLLEKNYSSFMISIKPINLVKKIYRTASEQLKINIANFIKENKVVRKAYAIILKNKIHSGITIKGNHHIISSYIIGNS